jgi:hypothetical protein
LQPRDLFETGIVTADLGIKATLDDIDVSFGEDHNNCLQSAVKLLLDIFITVVGWGIVLIMMFVLILFCFVLNEAVMMLEPLACHR